MCTRYVPSNAIFLLKVPAEPAIGSASGAFCLLFAPPPAARLLTFVRAAPATCLLPFAPSPALPTPPAFAPSPVPPLCPPPLLPFARAAPFPAPPLRPCHPRRPPLPFACRPGEGQGAPAASPEQPALYDSQLARSRRLGRFPDSIAALFVPDPDAARIGSGAATLQVASVVHHLISQASKEEIARFPPEENGSSTYDTTCSAFIHILYRLVGIHTRCRSLFKLLVGGPSLLPHVDICCSVLCLVLDDRSTCGR